MSLVKTMRDTQNLLLSWAPLGRDGFPRLIDSSPRAVFAHTVRFHLQPDVIIEKGIPVFDIEALNRSNAGQELRSLLTIVRELRLIVDASDSQAPLILAYSALLERTEKYLNSVLTGVPFDGILSPAELNELNCLERALQRA